MSFQTRRYVFLDYNYLRQVDLKKLTKVSDKIFVFVSDELQSIPFNFARKLQKLGKSLKWIPIPHAYNSKDFYHNMCFLLGRLHERISTDIEFALISDDTQVDNILEWINNDGRNCVRVKETSATIDAASSKDDFVLNVEDEEDEEDFEDDLDDEDIEEGLELSALENLTKRMEELPSQKIETETITKPQNGHDKGDNIVNETAKETIRRLIRSGNRPAEISTLKNYILLHNQELVVHGNIDNIIKRMEENNEIKISEGRVSYNF
jgi:PIN domain